MTEMRQKAAIRAIGQAWPHEPDEFGRTWTVTDWWMDGGDFPGFSGPPGTISGWTPAELALLAAVARSCGHDAALGAAEACRAAPPERKWELAIGGEGGS